MNSTVEYKGITYLIDKNNDSAGVLRCQQEIKHFVIPQSITYESKEYIITNILQNAFKRSKILNHKGLNHLHFQIQQLFILQFHLQSHLLAKIHFHIVMNFKKLKSQKQM